MSRTGRGDAGLTLLELLVALTLLGVLSVAMATATPSRVPSLSETARAVATELREARLAAIKTGAPTALTFDVEERAYGAPGALDPLPEGVDLAVRAGRETRDDEGRLRIGFFPDGSSTGGTVTLSRGTGTARRQERITVRWLTGRVRLDG